MAVISGLWGIARFGRWGSFSYKSHFLKFDDFYDKIIDVTLDTKKDYVSNVLNDLRDDFMQYCIYWNEKYYKTGFSDGVKLLDKALNS